MTSSKEEKIRVKHRLEYLAVRLCEFLISITPYKLSILNARILARIAFHVIRFRRKEALHRIKEVFPEITQSAADKIAYGSLRNLLLSITELIRLKEITPQWAEEHIKNCAETVRTIKENNKHSGIIIAIPHLDNWDLAGIAIAQYDLPVFSIAGKQHNALLNNWMNNKRAMGITVLERGSMAIREVLKRLKQKEVFPILPDVRMKQRDLTIPFLGKEANLGRGMALFAKKTSSPIAIAKMTRLSPTHHHLEIPVVIHPDPTLPEEEDIIRMTTEVMAQIEKQIRANPEQWFWYNKRWVLEPIND